MMCIFVVWQKIVYFHFSYSVRNQISNLSLINEYTYEIFGMPFVDVLRIKKITETIYPKLKTQN